MNTVNKPFRKKDAMQLVTSQPVYMDDPAPAVCLIVKFLRSPHANAIVKSIDTAVAKKVPGIDASAGSLGQGCSIAVGMALGAKVQGKDTKVVTLLGDGEFQEGQIWEALMSAAHYKLDNLTVMVDNNGLQIDGSNDQVMSLGDLGAKLRAFGFALVELPDGNDLDAVEAALSKPTMPGKPKAILAHTVKGKGVSFMEYQACRHGKAPNAEQRDQALKELEG